MAENHDEKHDKKAGKSHGGGGHGGGGHGGGGGSHEEHEGAPEWLISFADNVTLMMGFFVIMLAMNMKPAGGAGSGSGAAGGQPDAIDLAIAVREAFNNPVNLNSHNPTDLPLIQRMIERKGATEIQEDGPRGDDQDLQSIRPSDYHQLSGAVSFEDNAATLTPASRDALVDIATHMRGLRLVIEIRGHASAAEAFQSPDRAMQLSFDRAMSVGRVLAESGIDWKQLRLIAAGDNERLKPLVYDRSGQRRNQRVEVIVTNETMPEAPAEEAPPPTKPENKGESAAPAQPAAEASAEAHE